ncbi:Sorbitol dehydrogenase [Citrus sinensis]|uniref:Sorbitol dehydrogenase n=1 Tax=Citrus sinensis TaxID=2711 RepID=A0ACB8HTD7_CITSI|nr:Sorbitol dehydrogenase [Citrus sinensis]
MVIGHECAVIIEAVGSEVKSLEVGDRVALEPGISCGHRSLCKAGSYNLCPEMRFFGSPPTNGSLAHKVVHPAKLCYKLPDNVSLEEGAMCKPAREFGAPRIVITDVDVQRLFIARNFCADKTVKFSRDIEDVDTEVGKIQNAMGSGIDVSFDCVGFDKTMSTALNATCPGGKVCLIGLAKSEMTVALTPAAAR